MKRHYNGFYPKHMICPLTCPGGELWGLKPPARADPKKRRREKKKEKEGKKEKKEERKKKEGKKES